MRAWLVLFVVGICSGVPAEQGAGESYPVLDYPEEVPGLFEGDIELQPGENPTLKNVVGSHSRIWPNGVIPYDIQSSYPNTVKNTFHAAMDEIETRTKVNGKTCIHFQPRKGESAYMHFATGSGCHTPVGYTHRMCQVTIGHGCERQGTIMHEILHGLGFYHEQSRHDRDQYVTIHLDNVQAGHEGNFKKYEIPYIDELGQPYDYGSIMHYGMYAFAKDRSKPTIEPKKAGVTIGQRVRLSDIDVKEIQILYGCINRPSTHGGSGGFVTSAPIPTAAPPAGSDVCTFEKDFCSWTQSHNDQTDWRRHHGGTPTSLTGPATDPHGAAAANYIYVEASGHSNQAAKLDSKSYPGGDYCLEFYYHMYGSNMGTLYLNAVSGTHTYHLHTWSGDHGNSWHHYRVHINMHTTGSFKFEFEGRIGGSYRSDIALDDITVHPGRC
jgi:meprin B